VIPVIACCQIKSSQAALDQKRLDIIAEKKRLMQQVKPFVAWRIELAVTITWLHCLTTP